MSCIYEFFQHFFEISQVNDISLSWTVAITLVFNPTLPLEKWTSISQTTFSNAFSWIKLLVIWFEFHWKCDADVSIDNKNVLVQVMAWSRPGGKPLPEPMVTKFADA